MTEQNISFNVKNNYRSALISMIFLLILGVLFSCKKDKEILNSSSKNIVTTISVNQDWVSSSTVTLSGEFYHINELPEMGMFFGTDSVNILTNKTICQRSNLNQPVKWFNTKITGLSPLTKYYYRAYVSDNLGTNYGEVKSFITKSDIPNFTADSCYGGPFKSNAYGLIKSGYLEIHAADQDNFDFGPWADHELRYYMQLDIKISNNSLQLGTYKLCFRDSTGQGYFSVFNNAGEAGDYFYTGKDYFAINNAMYGYCEIISVDSINRNFSGTFYFDAGSTMRPGEIIKVRHGNFNNIKY